MSNKTSWSYYFWRNTQLHRHVRQSRTVAKYKNMCQRRGTARRAVSVNGILSTAVSGQDKCKKRKVKFSHTRYRALGPELIPVYRQSARR